MICGVLYIMVLYAGGWPFPSCKSPMQALRVGVSNSLRSYFSRPMSLSCYHNLTPCTGTYMVVIVYHHVLLEFNDVHK